MRFAFADPPYLGCGALYAADHPNALDCDDPEWHRRLIDRMVADFPDGWLLCLSTPSLRTILPMCPEDARVGAWVKPFGSYKPGVNPAYVWEPYIWRGGRRLGRDQETVRDWVAASITLRRGLTGAKPRKFCLHAARTLGYRPGEDEFVDLFPGTNAFSLALGLLDHEPRQDALL